MVRVEVYLFCISNVGLTQSLEVGAKTKMVASMDDDMAMAFYLSLKNISHIQEEHYQ